MGEIADELMASFWDDPDARFHDIGSEPALPKTCRYCNTKGLHWEMLDGRWRLHDKDKNPHYCMGGVVVLPAGKFPVGLDKWKERKR